jgi:hypothetical protein
VRKDVIELNHYSLTRASSKGKNAPFIQPGTSEVGVGLTVGCAEIEMEQKGGSTSNFNPAVYVRKQAAGNKLTFGSLLINHKQADLQTLVLLQDVTDVDLGAFKGISAATTDPKPNLITRTGTDPTNVSIFAYSINDPAKFDETLFEGMPTIGTSWFKVTGKTT